MVIACARLLLAAGLVLGLVGGWSTPSKADEPVTGFVYTTDLLPKGKFEISQWMTLRAHKPVGEFSVVEMRTEFEYGVSDRFQLAAYVNYERAHAFHNSVIDGSTLPPETLAHLDVGADDDLRTTKFTAFTLEGIYRILSPYTDPIGLAILIEPEIGPKLRELESRLILQKNFFDDRMIVALNATMVQEVRKVPGDPDAEPDSEDFIRHWDKETDVNFGLAVSYRFARNWSAALEVQHEREWAGFNPFNGNKATNSATYIGPTIHYGGQHFFATLTFLDQVPGASDHANPSPGFVYRGRNYADDFERFRFRTKIGWYF